MGCMNCTQGGITYNACSPGPATAVAADKSGLVWTDSTYLYLLSSANLTASPTQVALGNNGVPGLMVLDATNVYWLDSTGNYLYRTNRTTGAITMMQYLGYAPAQLAVDANYLYWAYRAGNAIMRMPLTGGTATPVTKIASGAPISAPTGIAVDSTAVYWINSGDNTVLKRVIN